MWWWGGGEVVVRWWCVGGRHSRIDTSPTHECVARNTGLPRHTRDHWRCIGLPSMMEVDNNTNDNDQLPRMVGGPAAPWGPTPHQPLYCYHGPTLLLIPKYQYLCPNIWGCRWIIDGRRHWNVYWRRVGGTRGFVRAQCWPGCSLHYTSHTGAPQTLQNSNFLKSITFLYLFFQVVFFFPHPFSVVKEEQTCSLKFSVVCLSKPYPILIQSMIQKPVHKGLA